MAIKLEPRSHVEQLTIYCTGKLGDAWFVMLALGIIHHHDRAVPAFGYWLTLLLTFLVWNHTSLHTPAENALNTKRTVVK